MPVHILSAVICQKLVFKNLHGKLQLIYAYETILIAINNVELASKVCLVVFVLLKSH